MKRKAASAPMTTTDTTATATTAAPRRVVLSTVEHREAIQRTNQACVIERANLGNLAMQRAALEAETAKAVERVTAANAEYNATIERLAALNGIDIGEGGWQLDFNTWTFSHA